MGDSSNKRQYERYTKPGEIFYELEFPVKTRVEYQLVGKTEKGILSGKYLGFSQNISTEGICFKSDQKLYKEDILRIEIHLVPKGEVISLLGEVRWCKPEQEFDPKGRDSQGEGSVLKSDLPRTGKEVPMYYSGVKLLTINGRPIQDTIYFDKEKKIYWSAVLDTVFKKMDININSEKGKA